MMINTGKKHVLIVCANEFLAYWGRSRYGTLNVAAVKKIEYISFETFLKRTPNTDTVVILDEVDQMLDCNSFKFQHMDEDYTNKKAFYTPSFIQEWKIVIGVSGTVSSAN